jgi:two-component system response regulator DesR
VIRILLAEDQALIRAGLAALLALEPDLAVVAQAGTGPDALEAALSHAVDVALLDIEMPGMSGLSVAERICALRPQVRVMILTTFGRPGYLRRAMAIGVRGYLLKDAPAADLAAAIRRVHAGERVVQPELALAALTEGDCPLTERERQVLRLAGTGRRLSAVARELNLAEGTVRNYLSEAIQKLGVGTRMEACRLAEERGWL